MLGSALGRSETQLASKDKAGGDMALVKTAVLLFAAPGSGTLNLKHDRLWYDHYFFHPSHGQAGYWSTQTDGERFFHGQVFDWLIYPGAVPDLSKRGGTAKLVVRTFEESRGVDFSSFDVVVVVLGVGPQTPSDGGSTSVKSKNRTHRAVVLRVGDRFDFVAHELGHALGLLHSFQANPVVVVGDKPGGYGHRFCIMSASLYGGAAAAYVPAAPRDGAREYTGLGPSLNGLTACTKGWIDVHIMNLATTAEAEFQIRARQWLGRFASGTPQGLKIISTDGSNHWVLDFYEPRGWDLAQPSPAVVLTQGLGGRAEMHYPGKNSGTYIGHVRLPITFGAAGASLNAGGFGVQVLEYDPVRHEVRVRVRRGSLGAPAVDLDGKVETRGSQRVGTGVTTWEQGEALCLTGTWSYEKLARSQEAVLDATYPLGTQGMTAAWSVEGVPLPPTKTPLSGSVSVPVTVRVADPKLKGTHEDRTITLAYDIEPLAKGSRLKLRNQPQDETFKLRIEVTLANSVGSGSALTWVDFQGQEYVYESAFYAQRDGCLNQFIDVGERYRPYRVVPFPQLWEQIGPPRERRVSAWLEALADHWERGEVELYEQGARALALELGVPDLGLRIESVAEAFTPPAIEGEIAPPAPPDMYEQAPDSERQRDAAKTGGPLLGARWSGYLVGGAIGAGLALLAAFLWR